MVVCLIYVVVLFLSFYDTQCQCQYQVIFAKYYKLRRLRFVILGVHLRQHC